MTRVDPFYRVRVAKVRYSRLHARTVARRSRLIIIDQASVIGPTVNDKWDEQLQVQPQVEPVLCFLLAYVMDHCGLVQRSIDLTASVTGNCGVVVPVGSRGGGVRKGAITGGGVRSGLVFVFL